MTDITFITGGQRSGKSNYAQKLTEKASQNPIYLATARVWDDDFKKRIIRHQASRDDRWTTIEEEKIISSLNLNEKVVLLDCITLWLTNIFCDLEYDVEKSLAFAKNEWTKFTSQEFKLIAVSNELGMGVHPSAESARKFGDLHGWMNQFIASSAGEVILMVSGIPVKIK